MATVVGLFDDLDGLHKAIDVLEKEGLGDDISQVFSGDTDAGANTGTGVDTGAGGAEQEVSNEGLLGGGQMIGTGGVANSGGPTHPMTVNLQGALSRLDSLGEEGGFFRNSVEHGGKLVVLETDDPSKAAEILQETGAERVHDPRNA